MADFLLTWGIAPSANNGFIALEYREYGTSTWIQYGGVLTPGSTSGFIYGLDDNTVYEFRVVNNCFSGDDSPSNLLEQYVVECPVFKQLESVTCSTIDFAVEELGGNITSYTVTLYDVGNPVPLDSFSFPATGLIGNTLGGVFTDLYPGKTYEVKITFVIQGASAYTITTCPRYSVTVDTAPVCPPVEEVDATSVGTSLTVNWTEPTPAASNGYIIYYRPAGSTVAYSSTTASTGDTSVVITIPSGVDYEGYVVAVCDPCCTHPVPLCQNYSSQETFLTTENNITVMNSYNNTLTIEDVTGGTIGALTLGLGYGASTSGNHGVFTDTIDFTVSGDSTVTGDGHLSIYVNGVLVDCIDIPAADYSVSEFIQSSSVITVGATDIIDVVLENGPCTPAIPPTSLGMVNVGTAFNTGGAGDICSGTITVPNVYLAAPNTDLSYHIVAYTDAALTTPLTGYNYINSPITGTTWNINSSTGLIGTSLLLGCV